MSVTSATAIPVDEYHQRWANAQSSAKEMGLDGLVVFSRGGGVFDSHWDVFYLANHYPQFPMVRDYPPHWRGRSHSAMILPLDGEPTLVVDIPDWRRDQVVVADVRFSLSVPECVAHAVNERGLGEARLGLVGSNALLAGAYRALLEELPGVSFVPADDLIEDLHVIKSPRELELIREASMRGIGSSTRSCGPR